MRSRGPVPCPIHRGRDDARVAYSSRGHRGRRTLLRTCLAVLGASNPCTALPHPCGPLARGPCDSATTLQDRASVRTDSVGTARTHRPPVRLLVLVAALVT